MPTTTLTEPNARHSRRFAEQARIGERTRTNAPQHQIQANPAILPQRHRPAGNASQTSDGGARLLLHTGTFTAWDVSWSVESRSRGDEKCSRTTQISFPYRGAHVQQIGANQYLADPNRMVIIEKNEPYRLSYPTVGEHAMLTIAINPEALSSVLPSEYSDSLAQLGGDRRDLRTDPHTQLMAAQLRQRLIRRSIGKLEGEIATLHLVRRALKQSIAGVGSASKGRPADLADQVKMHLSVDPWRRWSLAEIAEIVCVTPEYLTDTFRRVEGTPFYRYHLRLRLAFALTMLTNCDNLTTLAIELGFNSHSHFSSAFKKVFGLTPSAFKKSITDPQGALIGDDGDSFTNSDSAKVYVAGRCFRRSEQSRAVPVLPATIVA
jgi:AraC family transcriptional regulator